MTSGSETVEVEVGLVWPRRLDSDRRSPTCVNRLPDPAAHRQVTGPITAASPASAS